MPVRMSDPANTWIDAASCCEGPRPAASYADLPREHRAELLRFTAIAAGASAFFVALLVLVRPLPSRNLAAHVSLPEPPPLRAVSIAPEQMMVDAPRPLRRPARARAAYRLAAVEETVAAPEPPRRRNVFSRFLRTLARTVQASPRSVEPSS
jgi:hypothetical protein